MFRFEIIKKEFEQKIQTSNRFAYLFVHFTSDGFKVQVYPLTIKKGLIHIVEQYTGEL